ncbi:MAG: DUF551 domain-containing protein [Clostridiales bacterium]|nr:DUF551 domain-containing protein [Clostridiales bacterium]
MTDREKLVKLINEGIEIYSDGWQKSFAASETIVDHLIANGVTVQQWISVDDTLPEDGMVVLFGYANNKSVIAGYLDYKCMGWYDYADMPVARPTHWKPLPEPPKED